MKDHRSKLTKLLKFLTKFAAIFGVLWWLSLAFGAPQYLIYSDSYKDKKSGYKVFAWKRNILLPIESLATPVILSSDYSKTYDVPEKYLPAYIKLYPYKIEYKVNNFLFALLFMLSFIYWLSRSGKIVVKFEEANESDTLKAYNDYLSWSSNSFIRRFHARSQRKLAQEALIALPARGKLRLNLFSEGLSQQGRSSPFLDILRTLEKNNHHTFNLEVSHFDTVDLAEAKLETSEQEWPKNINSHDFLRSASAQRSTRILAIDWQTTEKGISQRREWLKENGELERFEKEDPKLLGNGSFICPKELVLVAPDIHYAKYTVQKYLHTILNSGIKRFAGTELVQINSTPNPSSPTLAIKFRCYDEKSDMVWCVGRNSTEPHPRRAGYEFLRTQCSTWKVGEKTVQGSNLLYYRLGIYFSYELIDKGQVIASGDYSCLPDSKLVRLSTPIDKIDSTESAEQKVFDATALSCVNNLFSRLMGIPASVLNKHEIIINKETVANAIKNKTETEKFIAGLEKSLRQESLQELLATSASSVYKNNKEEVNAIIIGYLKNLDSPEVIKTASALVALDPDLLNLINDLVEVDLDV